MIGCYYTGSVLTTMLEDRKAVGQHLVDMSVLVGEKDPKDAAHFNYSSADAAELDVDVAATLPPIPCCCLLLLGTRRCRMAAVDPPGGMVSILVVEEQSATPHHKPKKK